MITKNEHDADKCHGGKEAAKKAEDIFIARGPFAAIRHAIEQAEKYNYEYDQHRGEKCPAVVWGGKMIAKRWPIVAVFAALVLALLYYLYKIEALDSNRTVALFTA